MVSGISMSIDEMIAAADAYVLPCDVRVGHTTIKAGCKIGTVLRSIKVHAQAIKAVGYMSDATPEQSAAYHGDIDGDGDAY
jgi:hypothetical protein